MCPDLPIDHEVARIAARQHGNVSRAQLLELGMWPTSIARRVKAGHLHRVYPGVYSVGRRPTVPLERAAAAVLACGPGAALSHGSAMTLWGFYKRWDRPFEVVVPGDRRPRGIKVHRSTTLGRGDIKTHLGIRVTSPARTLFDMAPRMKPKTLTRVVNDALRGPLPEDALAEIVARLPAARAATLLRPFAENHSGLTYSHLEDQFRGFCEEFGLPRPLTNVRLAGYRVDVLFPHERVIVELDGWDFHKSRRSFESDRERDADTLLAGHVTVRITAERMKHSRAREAARLDAILEARRRELSRASAPGRRSRPRT